MKKLFSALAIMLSASAHSEWIVNENKIAVSVAETTTDILGIDVCNQSLVIAAPANAQTKDNDKFPVKAIMRIDEIPPWNIEATARVSKGFIYTMFDLTPQLLSELLQGKVMRIKWSDTMYTRFDLTGLVKTLSSVKCDKEYFPKSNDSDYFL